MARALPKPSLSPAVQFATAPGAPGASAAFAGAAHSRASITAKIIPRLIPHEGLPRLRGLRTRDLVAQELGERLRRTAGEARDVVGHDGEPALDDGSEHARERVDQPARIPFRREATPVLLVGERLVLDAGDRGD